MVPRIHFMLILYSQGIHSERAIKVKLLLFPSLGSNFRNSVDRGLNPPVPLARTSGCDVSHAVLGACVQVRGQPWVQFSPSPVFETGCSRLPDTATYSSLAVLRVSRESLCSAAHMPAGGTGNRAPGFTWF